MKLSLSFFTRLVLLFLLFMLGLILTGGMQFLVMRLTDNAVAATRITMVMQDLLAFILPALITAMLITRLPADFLQLRKGPGAWPMVLFAGGLIVGLPLIEWTNALCEQLPWPQSVLDLEAAAESAAAAVIGPPTGANPLVAILIVGVLTGVAEELFFRGALQRILATRPMSVHAAVWLTAVIFSLMHGQPVGFVARTLLGAWFGYAAALTGSLWTAVILHALNNSLAVGAELLHFDPSPSTITAAASAIAVAAVIVLLRRRLSRG